MFYLKAPAVVRTPRRLVWTGTALKCALTAIPRAPRLLSPAEAVYRVSPLLLYCLEPTGREEEGGPLADEEGRVSGERCT